MIEGQVDVAVIGAGPAGLAAAVAAKKHGAQQVLVIDRNNWLGGILPQCIHDGFGIEELGISLTGPEYADRYIEKARQLGIQVMMETMVLHFTCDHEIIAVNKGGIHHIQAQAIVLAMGCREKTRWHAMIAGTRPSGIYTAGVAQAFINLYNIMPGKNVLVLGSGDVGLIMARRLKFEGANVLGVVEIFPYASGLPRNIVQCLDDYEIPLYLNHTVTCIHGQERLKAVTISEVNESFTPIKGTEQQVQCDTLLLSLGLVPEHELSKEAGVKLDISTGGPLVNQWFETSVEGVFACGNCLQVYDTVDMLAIDAQQAGKHAARYSIQQQQKKITRRVSQTHEKNILPGKGVRTILPQRLNQAGNLHMTIRAAKPSGASSVFITAGNKIILKKRLRFVNPANMITIDSTISNDILRSGDDLEVSIQ